MMIFQVLNNPIITKECGNKTLKSIGVPMFFFNFLIIHIISMMIFQVLNIPIITKECP